MTRPPYLEWRCSIVVTRGAMEKPVHLGWLRINYKVALRWHFHCGCPISKPRSVLNFSSKIRDRFFFQKIKKSARMTRKGVFGDFSKKLKHQTLNVHYSALRDPLSLILYIHFSNGLVLQRSFSHLSHCNLRECYPVVSVFAKQLSITSFLSEVNA